MPEVGTRAVTRPARVPSTDSKPASTLAEDKNQIRLHHFHSSRNALGWIRFNSRDSRPQSPPSLRGYEKLNARWRAQGF